MLVGSTYGNPLRANLQHSASSSSLCKGFSDSRASHNSRLSPLQAGSLLVSKMSEKSFVFCSVSLMFSHCLFELLCLFAHGTVDELRIASTRVMSALVSLASMLCHTQARFRSVAFLETA